MTDVAILVLRVFVGLVMIPHGAHKFQKLDFVNKKWRENYGLPVGSAALSGIAEIVCGALLILGLFSSAAAFVLFLTMIVGTWTSIWKEHEPYLSLPTGKGWDFNLFLIGVLVAQVFLGDGALSLLRMFS